MTYKGTAKNGVVVLPPDVELPEGAEVDVTPREVAAEDDPFQDLVLKLAKPRPHLPPDYALNHGHYVRGEPTK
jgi:hypothetical protein